MVVDFRKLNGTTHEDKHSLPHEYMIASMVLRWTCLIFLASCTCISSSEYIVGVGRADCTGPSAEVTFMGYAKLDQKGCGIHLRQFARAFYFEDTNEPNTNAFFVSVDACMMNTGIKQKVIELLRNQNFTVDEKNLIISGTHTHNGPGGFLMDVMFDIPNLGFLKETFDALVKGISDSIITAYNARQEANIYVSKGDVKKQTNRNRSPTAYSKNPDTEDYLTNTDIEMVQLQFRNPNNNTTFGAINWFPVHPTSMNNTNCLISSDNVGYASILLETTQDKQNLPGQSHFVGAFASANLGDVSPNLNEPRCLDTGKLCDNEHSSCNGSNKYCVSLGPGNDIFESTKIIATNLFEKAAELLKTGEQVSGSIAYKHQYLNMTKSHEITLNNGTSTTVQGCMPAMGYAFAAGTTDGPGEFNFEQATNTSNPFWNFLRDFIFPPSPEDVECHFPKPILIMSGRIKLPYEWQPEVVGTQLLMIGQVVIAAVPGEFTTMSGRRMKKKIKDTMSKKIQNVTVIIAGLSNTYTNYIATPEEYTVQRYEGASTIYGPHTLDIYLAQYSRLADLLITGKDTPKDDVTYNFPENLLGLVPPVLFDTSGWNYNFGDCIEQPKSVIIDGKNQVNVTSKFIAGHPRNNFQAVLTFLTVEMLTDNDKWTIVANDASWETRFYWRRKQDIVGSSEAEIVWFPGTAEQGTYRICHFGQYKYILGGIYPYSGCTNPFNVTKS